MKRDLTRDQALALLDGVLEKYGIDPAEASDERGWRHLTLGETRSQAGVVKPGAGDYHLAVMAPVVQMPPHRGQFWGFYKALLELNRYETSSARFCLHQDIVYVQLMRSIQGLDAQEVERALHTVMDVVDSYGDSLLFALERLHAQFPPTAPLPDIKVRPKEGHTIATILARCDAHGQDTFRYIMERWQKMGYVVEAGTTGIGLKVPVGSKDYSLASMRPGTGQGRQLLILGWHGLSKREEFPATAVEEYQAAVGRIVDLKTTESTAHIEITETFDRAKTKTLLRAMSTLAKAVQPDLTEDHNGGWDASLPPMDIKVGPKTRANMQQTLLACKSRVQGVYAILIEGWHQAGGTVQCNRVGRIHLKLKTGEHQTESYGWIAHHFTLAALAAPKGKRGPTIDVAWDLANDQDSSLSHVAEAVDQFQAVVSGLPGFEQAGTVTRLVVGEAFEAEHARVLLQAMVSLKVAEQKVGGAKPRG